MRVLGEPIYVPDESTQAVDHKGWHYFHLNSTHCFEPWFSITLGWMLAKSQLMDGLALVWCYHNCLDGAQTIHRVKEWWYNVSGISGYRKLPNCHLGVECQRKVPKVVHNGVKWIWCATQSRKMTVWSPFFELEAVFWLILKLKTSSIQCTHLCLKIQFLRRSVLRL
jgi:hypothetical protein